MTRNTLSLLLNRHLSYRLRDKSVACYSSGGAIQPEMSLSVSFRIS